MHPGEMLIGLFINSVGLTSDINSVLFNLMVSVGQIFTFLEAILHLINHKGVILTCYNSKIYLL